MKPTALFLLLPVFAGLAYAQQMPNPLLKPQVNLAAPLPPPTTDGALVRTGQDAKDSYAITVKPRFDGWYVVFVTDRFAIIRSPDNLVGSGEAAASKPGTPGFGTGTQESVVQRVPVVSAAQTLELEHGEVFTLADTMLRADIQKGRVTISYLGNASMRRSAEAPEIVFVGRITSNAIVQVRTVEKPDDRYVGSVKPAPSSVKNVLSGGTSTGTAAASLAPGTIPGGGF